MVCLTDPECCAEFGTWDPLCKDLALEICEVCATTVCPPDAGGNCCENNGTPGCTNAACCELVCLDDWACCDSSYGWDAICLRIAEELCPPLCECDSFGDYDGDGDCDLRDFARFQTCFTGAGDPADFDCACGDDATDGRIDLTDYVAFHAVFHGR